MKDINGFLQRRLIRDSQGKKGSGEWLRYYAQLKGEELSLTPAAGFDDEPIRVSVEYTMSVRDCVIEDRSYLRSEGQYQPIMRLSYGRGVEEADYLAANHTILREWLSALHRAAREAMLLDCHWTLQLVESVAPSTVLPEACLLLRWPGSEQWTRAWAKVEQSKRAMRQTPARPLALYLYSDVACKNILVKLRHPTAVYARRSSAGQLVMEGEVCLKVKRRWPMVPMHTTHLPLQVPIEMVPQWVMALRTIFQLVSPKALTSPPPPATLKLDSEESASTMSGRPWAHATLRRSKSVRDNTDNMSDRRSSISYPMPFATPNPVPMMPMMYPMPYYTPMPMMYPTATPNFAPKVIPRSHSTVSLRKKYF